jgi:hypothetical protein
LAGISEVVRRSPLGQKLEAPLELQYIEPELREGLDEIERAAAHKSRH